MTPYSKKKAEIKRKAIVFACLFVVLVVAITSLGSKPWLVVIALPLFAILGIYYLSALKDLKHIKCQICGYAAFKFYFAITNFKCCDICPKCGNDNRVEPEGIVTVD